MIIHNVVQGSPEWSALRATMKTASEASAMMGASANTSRNELVALKATGSEKEFSSWAQRFLLDKGHAIEAKVRAIAEEMIGEELFPCTGSSEEHPDLLASFDGMTMLGDKIWEGKSWNEAKAAHIRERSTVPDCDYWQVVQQLVVSGAEACLYTISDGTQANTLSCWMELQQDDKQMLLACWAQFEEDVRNYKPAEVKPVVVADPVAGLPAITYKLNGLALTSNLDVFRKAAEAAVALSKAELKTDQDFANRDALCKSFADAETKIRVLKEQVLGEFSDIDRFTRELGEIGELIRQARLAGEKQVEARKAQIKLEIRQAGERAVAEHIAKINQSLGGKVTLPHIIDNFAGVMKGKRTLATLQDAVDTEVARIKVYATSTGEHISRSLELLREKANDYVFLFRDAQELVMKNADDLSLLIDQRIREHKESEAAKEAERARQTQREREELERKAQEASAAPAATLTESRRVMQAPAVEREPDLLDAAGVSATRVEIVDMQALVKAVANGEVPLGVLCVNMDVLAQVTEARGAAQPGTTWSRA